MDYLNTIASNKWILSWNSSPKYSGKTYLSPELTIGNNQEYSLVFINIAKDNQRSDIVLSLEFSIGIPAQHPSSADK